MGAFEYTAVDSRGRQHAGRPRRRYGAAGAPAAARAQLLPVKCREIAEQEALRGEILQPRAPGHVGSRSRAADPAAGNAGALRPAPRGSAARGFAADENRPRVQSILIGVRSGSWKATPWPTDSVISRRRFPEIYRATVAAGEQSGHLDAVLERLADYTESREVLRQKVSTR
jgi:general secretion pathway protein F